MFLGSRHAWCAVLPLGLSFVVGPAASATIEDSGPFIGARAEGFESFPLGSHPSLEVFGGAATINNLTPDGSLKVEPNSTLGGTLVFPRSGSKMGGQLGIAEWIFHEPPARFGGYFANNSGVDDALVTFFDIDDQIVAEDVLHVVHGNNTWTWNGWSFDAPIHRLEIDGNGLIDGFIWYDDMQFTPLPEPSAAVLLVGLSLMVGRHVRGSRACGAEMRNRR